MAKFQDKIEYLITAKVDQAIKNLKKVEQQQKKNVKSASSMVSKLKGAYVAAGAALVGFVAIGVKAIKAFAIQEKAELLLNKAFSKTSENAKELTEDFKNFAAEQQRLTSFGDEVTIMAAAQLQALAGLSGEGLKKAIKATMDLSVAQGIDLKTAALLVGKSVSSSTNALSRYGIEMDKGGTKTERLNNLTDVLSKKFGGFAEKEGASAAGVMARFSNNVGDLWEVLGSKLMPTVNSLLTGLNKLITPSKDLSAVTDDLAKHTAEYEDVLKKLNDETLIAGSNEERLLKTRKAQLQLDISKDIDKINDRWIKNNVTQGISLSLLDQLKNRQASLQIQFVKMTDAIDENDKSTKILGGSLLSGGGQMISYADRVAKARVLSDALQETTIELNNALDKQKTDLDKVTNAYLNANDGATFLKLLEEDLRKSVEGNIDAFKRQQKVIEDGKKKKEKPVVADTSEDDLKEKQLAGQKAIDDLAKAEEDASRKKLKDEQDLQEKIKQERLSTLSFTKNLLTQGLAFAKSIADSIFNNNVISLEKERELLLENSESNLALKTIAQEEDLERLEELENEKKQAIERGDEDAEKEVQREIDKINLTKKLAEEETAINKKKNQEVAEEKKKQAIFDKLLSAAQIGINTFLEISKIGAQLGVFAGPAQLKAGIQGGLAAGAALAKPIPAFAHGTPDGGLVTSGPQLFLAGDNAGGRERIDVTPLNNGEGTGASSNTYIFNGIEDLSGARNELMQLEGRDAWQ